MEFRRAFVKHILIQDQQLGENLDGTCAEFLEIKKKNNRSLANFIYQLADQSM